jgi:hypothetical protein
MSAYAELTPHGWVRPKRQLPPGFIVPVPAALSKDNAGPNQ